MQVSLYLNEDLVKRVDRLAKRQHRSRSKVIENLIESSLKTTGRDGRYEPLVGAWKDHRSAKTILRDLYKGRERNRRSERVSL